METEYNKNQLYGVPLEKYKKEYASCDPVHRSEVCGVPYAPDTQQFTLKLLGKEYRISHPDFEITCPDEDADGYAPLLTQDNTKILILRYLTFGRKTLFMGSFKPYNEMPWGNVYEEQFRVRCIMRLAFTFGNNIEGFRRAMEALDAERLQSSGDSYELVFLDDLRMRLTVWEADDEFPPSSQILFSDNFPYAFSGEDMAYVGDIVIGALKKYAGSQR